MKIKKGFLLIAFLTPNQLNFMKSFSVLVVVFSLLLSSCATIIAGKTQMVNVSSIQNPEAKCTLVDNKGAVYNVTTPGSVTVKRGDGPLNITCKTRNEQGEVVINETLEPWFFGNLILGGIIGGAIDASTGSYQKYPDQITISLVRLKGEAKTGVKATKEVETSEEPSTK